MTISKANDQLSTMQGNRNNAKATAAPVESRFQDQQYGQHPKQVSRQRSSQAHDCRLRIRQNGNLGVRAPQEDPRLHVVDRAP
jgi:hypothetical protein